MLPNYFEILGLSEDASEMEIKRAYRNKSREYHPSSNKSPGALDQFILVNEAYEILIHKNTHEIYLEDYKTDHDPLKYEVYYYWINAARTRAAKHASMTWGNFTQTKFYQRTHLYTNSTLMAFLVIGIVLLIIPFLLVVLGQQHFNVGWILAVVFISWPIGLYLFVQAAVGFQSMKKYMH
ncbi:MAG: J domain-containing protein [Chitinophagales bacterium]|nr:J domain-containing protein [Chitinophagales bacterium]